MSPGTEHLSSEVIPVEALECPSPGEAQAVMLDPCCKFKVPFYSLE